MSWLMKRLKLLFAKPLDFGDYKMIIVVRSDVPMTKGKIGAQCAHAAIECYRRASSGTSNQRVLSAWLRAGQPKIVVRISGERELLNLAKEATKAGLVTAIIKDAGRTQLQPGTISVLGIGPASATAVTRSMLQQQNALLKSIEAHLCGNLANLW